MTGGPDDVVVTASAVLDGAGLAGALAALPDAVRSRAVRTERVTQLALAAAQAVLTAAGLAGAARRDDVAVVLGTAFGCFLTNAEHQQRVATSGAAAASPRTFAATVSNAAAGEIGIAWRLGGPALTLTGGLVTGLQAVAEAAALVATGAAGAALAGGVDATGPALRRWLADAGWPDPGSAGDGAALVVLERRAAAAARGVAPWATLEASRAGFGAGPALDGGLSARGVATLCSRLAAAAPGTVVTVDDRCPSGHVAGLTARREETR